MLTEPARAAALRAPLLEALAASGASGLLSANLGCRLHLGNAVSMPVRHPIDFLAEHLA
jgi:glycolate oxidase iron-sulfur subunit